jgi:hypothetical protein
MIENNFLQIIKKNFNASESLDKTNEESKISF